MPSSKSSSRRVLVVGVLICLLVVVLGVIGLVWTTSAPSPRLTSTSTGESSAKTAETQELREASVDGDDGDARGASWISFERVLLLAVVVANYLLLFVVALSYWRGWRSNTGDDLSQRLQAIGAQLEAIERALRSGPPKPPTPPAPATPESAPKAKGFESSREPGSRLASPPAPKPMQQAAVVQEQPTSRSARTGLVNESRRSSESDAWNLVHQYCLVRGSSIDDLVQRAKEKGLQIGSPSFTRGQRHALDAPDQDYRLLAIKDSREGKLFVVVGADANVADSEWLDLFTVRAFPGVSLVRSKRPATVNAVSGEVEEKGELEVLGST